MSDDKEKKSGGWGKLFIGAAIGTFLIAPYRNGNFDDEIAGVKRRFGKSTSSPNLKGDFESIKREQDNRLLELFEARYGAKGLEYFQLYQSSYKQRPIVDGYLMTPDEEKIWKTFDKQAEKYRTPDKASLDNRSNQLNPNNDAYYQSRGYDERPSDWESNSSNHEYSQDELDNHSNQLNSNNDAYWQSRGYDERPDDWKSNDN